MRFLIQSIPVMVFLLMVAPGTAQDKDKPNPIEAEVKANLKDLTKPFVLIVHLKIKDGAAEKFEAAFAKGRAGTRKEKGNKTYDLSRSTKTPTEYIVYERWTNFAALQAHLKEAHFTTLIAEISELLAGPPSGKVFLPAGE
jgi:quinol monooxygenase YgiN